MLSKAELGSEGISAKDYESTVENTINNIKKLPPDELNYYLVLFVAAIHNETNREDHLLLLMDLNDLVLSLQTLYSCSAQEDLMQQLVTISSQLTQLIIRAQVETLYSSGLKIILNISAVISAMVVGILGALLGLAIGTFSQWNIFKGAGLGSLTGLCIGLIIGFRIPGTLILDPFIAKSEFILTSIERINHELPHAVKKRKRITQDSCSPDGATSVYEKQVKQYLLEIYFKDELDKEAAFSEFLLSEQTFQICTTQSGFVDRALKGSVGNHSLIRYKINEIADTPIEFGPRIRTPNFVDQAEEERKVTGQKLFEMLVLDKILQESHEMNLRFVLEAYQVGDNDCLTYINKILIGTQQNPAKIARFVPQTDTWVGTAVGRLFSFFGKTAENELNSIIPYFEDGNTPQICVYKREDSEPNYKW